MGKMSIDIAVSIDKNGNLISPIEIDKQVITKLGIYEICGNKYWIIRDKPAVEKAELPEKLKGDWVTDSEAINKICCKVDEICKYLAQKKGLNK